MEASRQGNTIQPIHFNLEAYKASEVYQLKGQAEQQTIDYLAFKKNQEEVRKQQAEIEAEIEARKREEAEFAKLNPIEKSLHSFKEIGTDFWDGLEARNEKKLDSLYDFGNYITVGSFDAAKDLYQGMEDRAHVAMNSPYDFVNYASMGTLDLGNGAINPEESFSKEHWLSSIGLASILAGGAKPLVPKPKTPSLQDRNLVLEQTVNKAHELTMKTKADMNFVIDEVSGGINVFLNALHNHKNLEYSPNVSVQKIPVKVMDTESVKKILDRVLSKFSLSGFGKGTGNGGKDDYFIGTLKGEKIHLKGVKVEEIIYTKRLPEETAKLRKEFNSSVRKNFLKEFANDPVRVEYLRKAGLGEVDIARMKDGLNPKGWQVHHNLPLDDGGTNDFTNLVLIKNDPYHKAVTNEQNSLTRGLAPKQSKTINWPMFEDDVYPPKPFKRREE